MSKKSRITRLRARLAAIRADAHSVPLEVVFYNLDNHRADAVVARELNAIARVWNPAIIGLCEVIGNELPDLPGYRLIRDRSTEARKNIAAYVRDDLPAPRERWIDLKGTWPRTETTGVHPPRSYLILEFGHRWFGFQVVVAHQPPKGAQNARALQQEGIDALTAVMAPWTEPGWRRAHPSRVERVLARLAPRLLMWDGNRRGSEDGPGPRTLALAIKGWVHGDWIDSMVHRGDLAWKWIRKHGRVKDRDHRRSVNLASDHKGAIRARFTVRAYWIKGRTHHG